MKVQCDRATFVGAREYSFPDRETGRLMMGVTVSFVVLGEVDGIKLSLPETTTVPKLVPGDTYALELDVQKREKGWAIRLVDVLPAVAEKPRPVAASPAASAA